MDGNVEGFIKLTNALNNHADKMEQALKGHAEALGKSAAASEKYAHQLVIATRWLVIATAILSIATIVAAIIAISHS